MELIPEDEKAELYLFIGCVIFGLIGPVLHFVFGR